MDFTILQPPGGARGSGGAYVAALAASLRDAGHGCTVTADTCWPDGGIVLIDGAGLGRFTPEQAAGAIGLIHDLPELASDAERRSLRQLRHAVVPSRAMADRLGTDFAVAAERISVVAPGAPDVSRSVGSSGGPCNILSVGDLVPHIGHGVLLQALALLFDLTWSLTIVGDDARDPAHATALRQQAAGLPGTVAFATGLGAAERDAVWQRSDVFALAADGEGSAAHVAEALRRGVPVAVTSGSAAELVTPETGIVCPPSDVAGFSKAIRRMIFDATLRADMADAAWQAGQALPGWPAQAARFLEAIASCC